MEVQSTERQRNISILQMVICGVLWSTGGIFIKLIPWNPFAIAGVRSLIAALVVLAFIFWQKIPFQLTKQSILSGLFMTGVFNCFVIANKLTTAANAIVLQFTSPMFMLILGAIFLHKKCRRGDIITVIVTLCGISLFFFDQLAPGNLLGNCFGILAGFMVAATYLAVGEVDENTRMSGVFLGQLFTAIIGLPFVFITGAEFTPTTTSCIIALGIIQLGIPYVLFALSMKHCSPLACNLIGAIEPLLNPVWVFLFDGEAPGIFALVGAVIVIVAIVSWCVWNDKAAPAEGPPASAGGKSVSYPAAEDRSPVTGPSPEGQPSACSAEEGEAVEG